MGTAIVATIAGEYHVGLKELPPSERPRERLLEVGAEGLKTSELLAIVLRTGTPRENVLELATGLLTRLGNLPGLDRLTVTELCEHRGLGPAKAIEIKAAFELGRRLSRFEPEAHRYVRHPSDVHNWLGDEMGILEQEHLSVIILNTKNRVVSLERLYRGSVNSTTVRVAEILRAPIRHNSHAIILVHNHPSGDPTPSPEDVRLTDSVRQAGDTMDIELLDHIVIGRPSYVSLRERGLGFPSTARLRRAGDS